MARINTRDPANWIPRDKFEVLCGPRAEALLAYYDKAAAKRNPLVFSWNWPALLLFPAWLMYRKMVGSFVALTALVTALLVAEEVFSFSVPTGAFVGTWIALSLMASGLYLTHANQVYDKRKDRLAGEELDKALRDAGGTSSAYALIGALIYLALTVGLPLAMWTL